MKIFKSRLFKNVWRHLQVTKNGYTVSPFLNNLELKKLRSLLEELHPNFSNIEMNYGIHMTSWMQDDDYKMHVKREIDKIFAPAVARTFQNYRALNHVFIIKSKNEENTFPVHQDWSIVDESKNISYNIWVPLYDVDENNGALWIIKKSHRYKTQYRGAGDLFPNYESYMDLLKPYIKPIKVKAGQALVFYHSTIHGSPPNKTENLRSVAACSVIKKNAPLCIYYKNPQTNNIEIHQPSDDFMFKYKNIRVDSKITPPTSKPIEILSHNEKDFNIEDFLRFIRP